MDLRKAVALSHLSERSMIVPDPIDLCREIVAHLHDRLDYRRSGILLARRGSDRLQVLFRCPAGLCRDDELREIDRVNALLATARGGVLDEVMDSGRPRIVNDVADCANYIAADGAMRSEACFPLMAGGERLGVIDIESEHTRKFDWDDHLLMSALAAQLSQVLHRHRDAMDRVLRRHEMARGGAPRPLA